MLEFKLKKNKEDIRNQIQNRFDSAFPLINIHTIVSSSTSQSENQKIREINHLIINKKNNHILIINSKNHILMSKNNNHMLIRKKNFQKKKFLKKIKF
jgi:hypothetical protein